MRARTGIDFAEYVDDELVDSVTGWSGLLGVVRELALSVGGGIVLAGGVIGTAFVADLDGDETIGLIVAGLMAGAGAAALTFALRLRRLVPTEVAKVFDVAAAAADRVARDVSSGRLTITAGDAARGVTLVAAIPALTRAARRRLPVLGLMVAPAVGAVLSRALVRVWPTREGTRPLSGLERPARRLHGTLDRVSDTVMPGIERAVRWATLPLAVAGAVLATLGVTVAAVAFSVN